MTVRCPACKSDSIRRSHSRRSDGAWRALLCTAYRCRNCHQRFFRLASAYWIAGAAASLAVGAVAFGWLLGSLYLGSAPDIEPIAAAPAPAPPTEDAIAKPIGVADEAIASLADRGDAKAQFELGMAYRDGRAGQADPKLALQWIAKSADQGYLDAQYALATFYLAGHGVLQSFPTAFEWFTRAARQNHADAQFHLGRMYRRGYGVPTDNVKAYVWFNLAAAQGHERAREARDRLLPLMSAEQVRAAQQESLEWKPMALESR